MAVLVTATVITVRMRAASGASAASSSASIAATGTPVDGLAADFGCCAFHARYALTCAICTCDTSLSPRTEAATLR
eukprot:4713841-Prymnesium_polylepis.1